MSTDPDEIEKLGGRTAELREVAAHLFYENGYHGTSLKDIATVMGLRAPSLYNHISSKQQLLQDLMFENTFALRSCFDAAIARSGEAVGQLRLAAESLMRHAAIHRFQVYVSMTELANVEEPAKAQLVRLRLENLDRWRGLIRLGCTEKVFATKHPGLAAQSIFDLGAGIAYWYRPGRYDVDKLVTYYAEIALRIVGAPNNIT